MRDVRRIAASILAAGLIVATAILVTERYTIGHVGVGRDGFTVYGLDTWSGAPFARTTATD
jgi:hypothetical protein